MESEINENNLVVSGTIPRTKLFSLKGADDGKIILDLHIVEFDNAIFAAIYENIPKLGSMTMGYPIEKNVEKLSLFTGNQSQFSDAMAMILSKKLDKLVYASVFLNKDSLITFDHIKEILNLYLEKI